MELADELNISIGSVPLRLHIPEPALREKARLRYSEFVHEAPEALPIFLTSRGEANSSGVADADLPQSRFTFNWESSLLQLNSANAQFSGVRHEYGLDSLIRVLLSVLLARQRGFLLHAASVMRNGRAYVFTGKSGAGKSTVAALSPKGSVLTDEISLLKFVDGSWQAFGTPFWGEFRAEGANIRAPIAGLYFLHQATNDHLEEVSTREALRNLLPNILFFSRDREMNESLLYLLGEFVASVPCHKLFFRKDPNFWSVLAA